MNLYNIIKAVESRADANREAAKKNKTPKTEAATAIAATSNRSSGLGASNEQAEAYNQYVALRDSVFAGSRPAAVKIASQPYRAGRHKSEEEKMQEAYELQQQQEAQQQQQMQQMQMMQQGQGAWQDPSALGQEQPQEDGQQQQEGQPAQPPQQPQQQQSPPQPPKNKEDEFKEMQKRIRETSPPEFIVKEMKKGMIPVESSWKIDLLEKPNIFQSAWAMKYCTVLSMIATGRSFWWVCESPDAKNGTGWEIFYIPTHWVTPLPSDEHPWDKWLVQPANTAEMFEVDHREMCYFAMPDPANPIGSYSWMQSQARSVNTMEQIMTAQYASMKNGIHPSVVLKAGRLPGMPGSNQEGVRPHLTPEQRRDLVTSIKLSTGGAMRHGEPFIVDGMIDEVMPFSMSPREMDFQSSHSIVQKSIYAGLGTNPYITGEISNANRATATVAEQTSNSLQINPIITLMSETVDRVLSNIEDGDDMVWIEKAKAFDAELQMQRVQMALPTMTKGEVRHYAMTGELLLDEREDDSELLQGGGGGAAGGPPMGGEMPDNMNPMDSMLSEGGDPVAGDPSEGALSAIRERMNNGATTPDEDNGSASTAGSGESQVDKLRNRLGTKSIWSNYG